MTPEEVQSIVDDITYKPNWRILFNKEQFFLQLEVVDTTDAVSFEDTSWKSGKRILSKWMCRQEIVGVVYSLIEAAEIHEMREWFRYKGRSIYNPHIDPDALVEVASKLKNFNCRVNSMSMEEPKDENKDSEG